MLHYITLYDIMLCYVMLYCIRLDLIRLDYIVLSDIFCFVLIISYYIIHIIDVIL